MCQRCLNSSAIYYKKINTMAGCGGYTANDSKLYSNYHSHVSPCGYYGIANRSNTCLAQPKYHEFAFPNYYNL